MTDHESVNPATRNSAEQDEDVTADTNSGENNGQRASRPNRQAEQNHDANTQDDPSKGKRHDQQRRNDKRGQMGG